MPERPASLTYVYWSQFHTSTPTVQCHRCSRHHTQAEGVIAFRWDDLRAAFRLKDESSGKNICARKLMLMLKCSNDEGHDVVTEFQLPTSRWTTAVEVFMMLSAATHNGQRDRHTKSTTT